MFKALSARARTVTGLLTIALFNAWLSAGSAWAVNQPPLSRVTVPEPPNLSEFVKDKSAAIRLGKAFFWDMQVGSDGVTACASCHYRAGADPFDIRSRNQIHPGPNGTFDVRQPSEALFTSDFPFVQVSPVDGRLGIDPLTGLPLDPNAFIFRNHDDVAGSQGVLKTRFNALIPGSAVEDGTVIPDPVFNVGGANVRQVTGRNSPSVINAIFNFNNFWDGRAHFIFNGENPLGPLDVNAGVWVDNGGQLLKQKIAIPYASLASQAVGPPLSDVEMSFVGRTFPDVGRKMLDAAIVPLGKQHVHPRDSVLGPLAKADKGLNANYAQMIRDAFQDSYWSSTAATPDGYTQMEANFSLFWGLAIQLYEATLVSDRTPFDLFQAGNQNALSIAAQRGFSTFDSKCAVCHSGAEFSSAVAGTSGSLAVPDGNPPAFIDNALNRLIQLGFTNVTDGLSDAGYFNLGVRPEADDVGRGAGAPDFPFPLSFAGLALLQDEGQLPFETPRLPPFVPVTRSLSVNGSFKTPGLRNVELTAPYFHTGSALFLAEVVEFYTRGGNFPNDNPDLALNMQPIGKLRGDPAGRQEVVDFLMALTDERVRNETAPFDHPELLIPSGDQADTMITLPATGGTAVPVLPALFLNPVTTPTTVNSQLLSGSVDSSAMVEVRVNNLPPVFATVVGNTWTVTLNLLPVGNNLITITAGTLSGGTETKVTTITVLPAATISGVPLGGKTTQTGATLTIGGTGVVSYQYGFDGGALSADIPVATKISLSGLADGIHTITVFGKDADGNRQLIPTTASWVVKTIPPVLTINELISPTRGKTQMIGGTVDLGSVPSVTVDTSAKVGIVKTIGGTGVSTWNCEITDLAEGINRITVTALDFVFNKTTVIATIKIVSPDGNLKGTGTVDISDALKALRIAVQLVQPTQEEMLRGDVAPLVNGVPDPDDRIDIADALAILRKVVGLISF